jgi:hypothetical protein
VAFNQRDLQGARRLFEEAAGMLRGPGDMNFMAYSIRRLAHIAWLDGNYETASRQCEESLQLNREVGDPRGAIACVAGFAAIALRREEYGRAAALMAALDKELAYKNIRLLYLDRVEFERNLSSLRGSMSRKSFERSWARGKGMSFDEAIALALETSGTNA